MFWPVRWWAGPAAGVLAAALAAGCGTATEPPAGDSRASSLGKPTAPTPGPDDSPVPPHPTAPVPPEPDPEPATFWNALQRWHVADATSYRLRYVIRCQCPDRGRVTVVVERGRVVDTAGTSSPLTVSDLFAVARRAYAQADDVDVRFSRDNGVPTRLSVDIDDRSRGEEVRYRVLRLLPQH